MMADETMTSEAKADAEKAALDSDAAAIATRQHLTITTVIQAAGFRRKFSRQKQD